MIRTRVAVIGLALAGGLAPATAAWAADPPPGGYGGAPRPKPAGQLTIGYLADAGFAAAVKLTCEPDGGGHPKPRQACATLDRVAADPDRLPPGTGACIKIYQPVTAEIKGTWKGKPVTWSHRYGNACEMRQATGVLFQF